ncbi:hypothetical protein SISNIDRAFT_512976 [Sistotremastrum niveocremeum HHB9708]|uniref:Uncharacterized protein n=1 Tax=Sistotremastrum niveocremeum HHB9708 TaxID=1314777 RepID=A0A164T4M7_9AGAM|nr:hypothetical protein SISNIDRAFT_512976 [Sistotremastrum niveocremeum HHB9708]
MLPRSFPWLELHITAVSMTPKAKKTKNQPLKPYEVPSTTLIEGESVDTFPPTLNTSDTMPYNYPNLPYFPQEPASGSSQAPMMSAYPTFNVHQNPENQWIYEVDFCLVFYLIFHDRIQQAPQTSQATWAKETSPTKTSSSSWNEHRKRIVTASKNRKSAASDALVTLLKNLQQIQPDIFGLICAPDYKIGGLADASIVAVHIIK